MDKVAGERGVEMPQVIDVIKPSKDRYNEVKLDDSIATGYKLTWRDIISLEEQAIVLGLPEEIIGIHAAVSMSDLEKFDEYQIDRYCHYMGYQSLLLIETYLMKLRMLVMKKVHFVEMMRYHEYLEATLFRSYKVDVMSPSDYSSWDFMYYDMPDEEDLLSDGIDKYYLRIGALTVDSLKSMYTMQEMIMFMSHLILRSRQPYAMQIDMTVEEMAAEVVILANKCQIDSRYVLGPNIVWKVHNLQADEKDLLIVRDGTYHSKSVNDAFRWQGLVADGMTEDQKYAEYCLNVLTRPNFCTSLRQGDMVIDGDYIKYYVSNVRTGPDALFYGVRTGGCIHKYQMFNPGELYDSFMAEKAFINPIDGSTFPPYAMVRLEMIIKHQQLKRLIKHMLSSGVNVVNDTALFKKTNTSDGMMKLFTFASEVSSWQSLSATLPSDMMMKNSLTALIGPEINGDLDGKLFRYLMITMKAIRDTDGMSDLHVMKIVNDVMVVSRDTLMSYMRDLVTLKDFGSYRVICLLAGYLLETWVYYNSFVLPNNTSDMILNIDF